MEIYREKTSPVCTCLFAVALLCGATSSKGKPVEDVAGIGRQFLQVWLIEKDVDGAVEYLSDSPIMGSCLGDPNKSMEWRLARPTVIAELRPVFARLASDTGAHAQLDQIIASNQDKFDYPRIKHPAGNLFDLYPVGPRLLEVVERGFCEGKDKSDFFRQGIRRPGETYLMLFHFKEGGMQVAILWRREGFKIRIVSIDFPY